jgi:hypothetical protein
LGSLIAPRQGDQTGGTLKQETGGDCRTDVGYRDC